MRRLLLLRLRRERIILPVWLGSITLLVLASTAAVRTEFGSDTERASILALALATPSLLALRGAPNGPGLGSMMFFSIFAFLALAAGLLNTFFATRHGRGDEEQGRRELLEAAPLARSAPLLATLLLGSGVNLLLGLSVAAAFVAGGLDATGSLVAGAALAVTGLGFLGVGVLAGELAATSRGANGIGATVVLGAYVARAAGDALGEPDLAALRLESAWPSWLSPIGWGQQTFAFTDNRLTPLLLSGLLALATTAAGVAVRARRELGGSLLPERRGRPTGRPLLRSGLGLAWRLHWPGMLGWTAGAATLGLLTASLATAVGEATVSDPELLHVLERVAPGGKADIVTVFVAAIMVIVGSLAAAAGVQALLRLRGEESAGRAELSLATPLSRSRWLAGGLTVALGSTVAVLSATAATTWLGFLIAGESRSGDRAVAQALIQLPAALVFVGVAALLVAVAPRVCTGLGWGLYALGLTIGLFGELLRLPDPVLDASPLTHVPTVPVADWSASVALFVTGVAMCSAAVVLVGRRDLTP